MKITRDLSQYFYLVDCIDEVRSYGVDEDYLNDALDCAVVSRLCMATSKFLSNIEAYYPEEANWLVENYIDKKDGLLSIFNKCNKGLENFLTGLFYEDFEWLVIKHPKYLCDIIYITSLNCYEDWSQYEVHKIKELHEAGNENPVLNYIRDNYFDDEDDECPF